MTDDNAMAKQVYSFAEGDGKNKKLLGGKGANLCEMTQIGLNVPPGFVITTEACLAYLASGSAARVDGRCAGSDACGGRADGQGFR
jgi:pyruvate,orthophosphate dikinase